MANIGDLAESTRPTNGNGLSFGLSQIVLQFFKIHFIILIFTKSQILTLFPVPLFFSPACPQKTRYLKKIK